MVPAAIHFRNGQRRAIIVEEALHQRPVNLLPDAPFATIKEIGDPRAVRQGHAGEPAGRIIGCLGDRHPSLCRSRLQHPGRVVAIGGGAVLCQAILRVVTATDCAARVSCAQTVAVTVVCVLGAGTPSFVTVVSRPCWS